MRGKSKQPKKLEREDRHRVQPIAPPQDAETSRNGVYLFAGTVFLVVSGITFFALMGSLSMWSLIIAFVVGTLAAFAIRIAPQWERVAVLRLGKYHRTAGPGLFFIIPIFEHAAAHVDQRMITTPFSAEEALTADLVPLGIDAVLFWMVWNTRDACVEVENYPAAVWWAAQTALRDAVGRINLAEVASRREQLDAEITDILTKKTNTWGISVVAVEIRDLTIPIELQDAMSREAQAERERNARLLLAEVEKDISEMLADAATVYDSTDTALQLRTMSSINESVRENGGLVIAPSGFGEAYNTISSFKPPK